MTSVRIGGRVMANPRRKIRVADCAVGWPEGGGENRGVFGSDMLDEPPTGTDAWNATELLSPSIVVATACSSSCSSTTPRPERGAALSAIQNRRLKISNRNEIHAAFRRTGFLERGRAGLQAAGV